MLEKWRGPDDTLRPDEGKKYKVLRITNDYVLIALPDGTRKKLLVPY